MAIHSEVIGSVASQWRYPVKSMRGERVDSVDVTERGLVGDRTFALIDSGDGKVASAKNPRKWPTMFALTARYIEQPQMDRPGVASISLPDGRTIRSDAQNLNAVISGFLGRLVTLQSKVAQPRLEEYRTVEEDVITVDMPRGTFFDSCIIHILTTATLKRMKELYPGGEFDERRFRPNLVIDLGEQSDFVENSWVGKTIAIGDEVLLKITEPCMRCVMTTLPQGDLPKDPGILRTAAQHNKAAVGVQAVVQCGGTIRRGDPIRIQ